jgi:lysozyme family protein
MTPGLPDLFPYSFTFLMSNEVYIAHGQTVSLYEDPHTGEVSNYGISLAWFKGLKPDATASDIKALTQEGAERLCRTYFWNASDLSLIQLPTIAAKVLDFEFNGGHSQGVRLLQQALGLAVDGMLGTATAAACNGSVEPALYKSFIQCAARRYEAIHDAQVPKYGQTVADKNLKQWLARLAKVPAAYVAT